MNDKEKNDLEETTLSVDERLKRHKKEVEEPEDVEPIEDKDFGLHPAEYEAELAEIEAQRKSKLLVLEEDVPLQTRNVNLERIDDE